MNLALPIFFLRPGIVWWRSLRKRKVKLGLFTHIDKLAMLKNGIRCGLWNGFNQCAKSNNKYVRDYGKNKESS